MKLLGIVVVVALLVSLVGIRQVGAADAVPFVKVSTVDGYVGEYEEYHISFLLSRDVKTHETLSIVFDDVVTRARLVSFTAGDVLIDGTPVGNETSWSGHTLTTAAQLTLTAGVAHELTILPGAMVKNPWDPCNIRLSLRDNVASASLVSNYYVISTTTRVSPVSLTLQTSGDNHVTVLVHFRTGRNGALTGNPTTPRAVNAVAASPDTISLRLSPSLSSLWDRSETVAGWLSNPLTSLAPSQLRPVSATSRLKDQQDGYKKDVEFGFNSKISDSTEVLVRLEFDRTNICVPLTTDDFVLVWTSKESTVVRIPLTGVPDAVPVSSDLAPEPDMTAPVITWNVQQSAFSTRLLTLNISIMEDNLDEAYFVKDGVDSLHTRLAVGDTGLMVINRSGIHGTIVATDKAGNTTTVLIDLPAPSGS
jgi:hypothetical protein